MTEPRPRILILTNTPINREPRALKQIHYFMDRADVTTAGFGGAPAEGVTHIELDPAPRSKGVLAIPGMYTLLMGLRLYRLFERVKPRNRSALKLLKGGEWDVVITHDVATVGLAERLRATAGLLIDLHEYAPRQGENSRLWRIAMAPYFRWICRTKVPRAAGVTTVGQGIIDEYRKNFGFDSDLVVNATPHHDLEPQPVRMPIRLVHSGIAAPARKPEVMIEAVKATRTPVTLDLYFVDTGSAHYQKLVALADGDERIRFPAPVPYAQLVPTLNTYDVGLGTIAPSTFNLKWCLPNKFFDFIQARLGVIVGPSPEMARIVQRYDLGQITDDFTPESLTRVLDALTAEEVAKWKENSHRHARELSSEEQVKVWGAVVDRILSRRPGPDSEAR